MVLLNFKKCIEEDKDFLVNLRIKTMDEYLKVAGIFLSEGEHLLRVENCFECANIIWFNNEKVGMIKFTENEDEVNILQLQISPNFQGRGIGKKIMEKFKCRSAEDGKTVRLKVLKNYPALKLYERLGFKKIGEDNYEYFMEYLP